MGIDAGFDMVPPLSKGCVDKHNWDQFIHFVKNHFKDDAQVEIKSNYIVFKAGEHPMLPFEGHKFLRFSSKVSGSTAAATGVERYIDIVTRLAEVRFGSCVQYWNEAWDRYGTYDWDEVNESFRSYEQLDEIDIPNTITSFLTGTDPIKQLDIPLFEVQNIKGKGRGLVAQFNISKGTRILCEKPIFTARPTMPSEFESALAAKLMALPKDKQRQFLALHNKSPGKDPFTNTFKTNALPCGSGSAVGGVYPTICLINHSCVPNAHNNWNENAKHETIHAIRPIKAGEEITIPYDHGGASADRHAHLKKSFNFDCDCRGCSLPISELHESDIRRLRIGELDREIGNPMKMMCKPKESLKDCRSLLQTLEIEFDGHIAPHDARSYYDAFQISIAHGDQARASVFAEKAYNARVTCEGEDSPETQRMKSLALKLASHASYEVCSRRWRTTMTMIPKGLSEVQFEEWLYRM